MNMCSVYTPNEKRAPKYTSIEAKIIVRDGFGNYELTMSLNDGVWGILVCHAICKFALQLELKLVNPSIL